MGKEPITIPMGQISLVNGKITKGMEMYLDEIDNEAGGREVELVGVPLSNLEKKKIPGLDLCKNYFSRHSYYSSDKLIRDVPEFKPKVSLESGMRKVIKEMDSNGKIPNSDEKNWEDQIIKSQRKVKITISDKIGKLLFKIKRKLKK